MTENTKIMMPINNTYKEEYTVIEVVKYCFYIVWNIVRNNFIKIGKNVADILKNVGYVGENVADWRKIVVDIVKKIAHILYSVVIILTIMLPVLMLACK